MYNYTHQRTGENNMSGGLGVFIDGSTVEKPNALTSRFVNRALEKSIAADANKNHIQMLDNLAKELGCSQVTAKVVYYVINNNHHIQYREACKDYRVISYYRHGGEFSVSKSDGDAAIAILETLKDKS